MIPKLSHNYPEIIYFDHRKKGGQEFGCVGDRLYVHNTSQGTWGRV